MTEQEDFQRLLHHAGAQIPASNAPVEDLIRYGRRSKKRRNILHAASVAAAVALISVGAFVAPSPIGGGGKLATQATTATSGLEGPPTTSTSAASCLVEDLGVTRGVSGAWHGKLSQIIEFANQGDRSCRFRGSDIGIRFKPVGRDPVSVDMTPVANRTTVLRPGYSAHLLFGVPGACGGIYAVVAHLDVTVTGHQLRMEVPELRIGCGKPRAIDLFTARS